MLFENNLNWQTTAHDRREKVRELKQKLDIYDFGINLILKEA